MKLRCYSFILKNKGAFRVAHGSRTHTDTLIVSLERNGFKGLGEAAHVPYYGIEIKNSIEAINKISKDTYLQKDLDHESLNEFLVNKLGGNHFAICAVDMAYWDLKSQESGLILSDYIATKMSLEPNIRQLPLSNFTIGIGTLDEMVAKVKATDFPALKVKLGTNEDDKIIKAIRQNTDATLRIDANTGWKTSEAIYLSQVMLENDVEFIEQPFAREAYDDMEQLQQSVDAIFIADESCKFESDVENCIGAFDGVNIKLSKCGGLTPALRMITQARSYDMKIMIGCMTESSIGISALSHLLPYVDYADLDGALLIENDPALGVVIDKGVARFRKVGGHGGKLLE